MQCEICNKEPGKLNKLKEEDFKKFYSYIYCPTCIRSKIIEKSITVLEKPSEINKLLKEIENVNFSFGPSFPEDFDDFKVFLTLCYVVAQSENNKIKMEFITRYNHIIQKYLILDYERIFINEEREYYLKGDPTFQDLNYDNKENLDQCIREEHAMFFYCFFLEHSLISKVLELLLSFSEIEEDEDYINLRENIKYESICDKTIKIFDSRIREFIVSHLHEKFNKDYLDKGIPKDLLKELKRKLAEHTTREPYNKKISLIDMCTIRDYQKIIFYNWENIFKEIFNSRTEIERHIEDINFVRNKESHSNDLSRPYFLKYLGSIDWFNTSMGFEESSQ